jgi:hypothetical protein
MRHHLGLLLCVTSSCLMGLAGLLIPVGDVYPRETNQSCNAKGYVLCSGGQCGSVSCGGTSKPGDSFCSQGTAHPTQCYMCDGCTGQWKPVGSSEPGQGRMVPPGTMLPPPIAPPSSPRMPGTVAPGMTAPILPRGIEGEPPAGPPPDKLEPSEQPSGKTPE